MWYWCRFGYRWHGYPEYDFKIGVVGRVGEALPAIVHAVCVRGLEASTRRAPGLPWGPQPIQLSWDEGHRTALVSRAGSAAPGAPRLEGADVVELQQTFLRVGKGLHARVPVRVVAGRRALRLRA